MSSRSTSVLSGSQHLLTIARVHYYLPVAGTGAQCIERSWIADPAEAAGEAKALCSAGHGTERGTWLVHGPSHHQVSLVLSSFVIVQINIQVSCLVSRRTNRPIHRVQSPRGGWKGVVANKMPRLTFKLPLTSLQTLPTVLFSLFKLIFLSFGLRQGGGHEPDFFDCWGSWNVNAKPWSPQRRDGILKLECGGLGWAWKRLDTLAVDDARAS